MKPGESLAFRVYPLKHGYDSFNPGYGDSRFAPFADVAGRPVPALYLGEDETVALLESVFHEVGIIGDRVIYERELRERGLACVTTPGPHRLADLRDPALARLGLTRDQLVTTDAAHYPCTREWAGWFHRHTFRGQQVQGLLWHSRKAELVPGSPPREVEILFDDRVVSTPGSFPLAGPGVRNLFEGAGRLLVDAIADVLDAVVEPMS